MPSRGRIEGWLWIVFGASGFAALAYQVVWQRSLFTIYGINVESVTVVVTAFMLGLGLGSLLGGRLSRSRRSPLAVFAGLELGIGLFGLASLQVIRVVGSFTLGWSPPATALVTFLLVLAPTLMMGATLPLLVTYAVRRSGNVGDSVGTLYFVNTVGSAAASFATVLLLMGALGLQGTVTLAAALNIAVSAWVYGRSRREVPA